MLQLSKSIFAVIIEKHLNEKNVHIENWSLINQLKRKINLFREIPSGPSFFKSKQIFKK